MKTKTQPHKEKSGSTSWLGWAYDAVATPVANTLHAAGEYVPAELIDVDDGEGLYDYEDSDLSEDDRRAVLDDQLFTGRAVGGALLAGSVVASALSGWIPVETVVQPLLYGGGALLAANEFGIRAARAKKTGVVPGSRGDRLMHRGKKTRLIAPAVEATAVTYACAAPILGPVVALAPASAVAASESTKASDAMHSYTQEVKKLEGDARKEGRKIKIKPLNRIYSKVMDSLKDRSAKSIVKNCLLVTGVVLAGAALATFCVGTFGIGMSVVTVSEAISSYFISSAGLATAAGIAAVTYTQHDKILPYVNKAKEAVGWRKSISQKESESLETKKPEKTSTQATKHEVRSSETKGPHKISPRKFRRRPRKPWREKERDRKTLEPSQERK